MKQEPENTIYKWLAADGTGLFAQSWKPTGTVKAVIALVHGLGEHSGRYAHWAAMFCEKDIAFVAMDLRGHGHSGGKKGHTPSYEILMDDTEMLIAKAGELFPGVPVILYGHSMGGTLAANYILMKNPGVRACVITSPWLKLSFEVPKLKLMAGNIVKGVFPSFSQPSGLVADYLSHDKEVVRLYLNDPLVHNKISITLFSTVYKNGLEAIRRAGEVSVPCLLMHGEDDKITSPGGSEEFAAANPAKVSLKIWEGAFHELHNEPIKKEVFQYLYDWLKPQIA